MISVAQVFVVLLVGVSAVILLYWRRRRHSTTGTLVAQAEAHGIEAPTRVATKRGTASVTSQEITEGQVHQTQGADMDDDDLELRTDSADDHVHSVNQIAKEEVLGEEGQPDDTKTPTNTDGRPEPFSGPSTSGSDTSGYCEISASADSLRDGKVTQSRQPPPDPNSSELPVEPTPVAATESPVLDSHGETPADEKAEEDAPPRGGEDESTIDRTTGTPPPTRRHGENQPRRRPRRYEGIIRRPPGPGNDNRRKPRATDNTERGRSLPIEVRLRFDRGGSCVVSLIPSRSLGDPEGATVASAFGPLDLRAMQDQWYEDVTLEDIARILCEGTIWSERGGSGRWSLSGRDLYVLGEHLELSGWVSQPSLKLGRKHVILCTEQLRPAVEQALLEAGVDHSVALDISFGSPAGWVVFGDVVPVRAASASGRADILNALRPLPELEICLEGGIRLEYAAWLDGYPPLIRVYGDPADTPEVRIDGCTASCGDDGAYRAAAWDEIGTHTVWCAGISRSYSIVPFQASWALWNAHTFSVTSGSDRRVSICGPVVRDASASQDNWPPTIQVPETNTVILGAAPGEHALAMRASQVRGMPCIATPSFRPVWALPPDPLHCIKQTNRILFLGEHLEPIPRLVHYPAARGHPGVDTWANLILNASRKGLAIEPDTERERALWRRYKRAARNIWRSRK